MSRKEIREELKNTFGKKRYMARLKGRLGISAQYIGRWFNEEDMVSLPIEDAVTEELEQARQHQARKQKVFNP